MAERTLTDNVTLLCCSSDQLYPYLDAAARLRIEVFRSYPYLYDGTAAYEREYLQHYLDCPQSIFVCALVGEKVVGISTALPLTAADADFQRPFLDAEMPLADYFYLGESVLLPQYRGRGIGHVFFDHREAHARKLGYRMSTFCSVLSPDCHPHQPTDYRSNESFWRKRGYNPTGLHAHFDWKEVDQAEETSHELEFWSRSLI